MLYFILRPLTRIALKAYFRRITVNGLDHIPRDGAILLCSNHPTGFIEPCLLACFLPRTLHFLVRGDLFEKPVLKHVLISTNQIPIYRFRDGFKKLRDNQDVMSISYNKLADGAAILIFPEASTQEVKHLRPIKKGAARMALDALKLHPDLDLKIIPIGINYSKPNQWRSYVTINVGSPISPTLPDEPKLVPQSTLKLTKEIQRGLSNQLLLLNEGVTQEKLDDALVLGQWENRVKGSLWTKYDETEKFEQERRISEKLQAEDTLPTNLLSQLGTNFKRRISVIDLLFALIILIPVALILILNSVPVLFGIFMRKKYVREREFLASVTLAASLGMYMILFPIALIISIVCFGYWGLLILFLPLLGMISLRGMDYIRSVWNKIKLNRNLGEAKISNIIEEGLRKLNEIRNTTLT